MFVCPDPKNRPNRGSDWVKFFCGRLHYIDIIAYHRTSTVLFVSLEVKGAYSQLVY